MNLLTKSPSLQIMPAMTCPISARISSRFLILLGLTILGIVYLLNKRHFASLRPIGKFWEHRGDEGGSRRPSPRRDKGIENLGGSMGEHEGRELKWEKAGAAEEKKNTIVEKLEEQLQKMRKGGVERGGREKGGSRKEVEHIDSGLDKVTQTSSQHDAGKVDSFEDQYFAPILESFRKLPEKSKQRFRSGSIPKVYIYTMKNLVKNKWLQSHFHDIQNDLCALPCSITTNHTEMETSDAVLVHLRSIQSRKKLLQDLGPRDPTQPWVMFEPETHLLSNALFHVKYRTLDGIFNRTFHHRRDSDILMLHGFIVRRGIDTNLLPPSWRREPVLWPTANRSKLAVTFVSNCRDNSGRLDYINALKKFAPIDVYGKCGNLRCGHSQYAEHQYRADTDPCMQKAARKYLFFLAFENALCQDYVTEKLYNLLYYPMVPVVLGAADYSELLPPHSYIDARSFTPEQLALRLTHLASHPQEYSELLAWRQYYQPSTVGGARMLCDLCTRLHDPNFYHHKVYQDFNSWYVVDANCNRTGTVHIDV